MNKIGKSLALSALVLVAAGAGYIAIQSGITERDIEEFETRVAAVGAASPAPAFDGKRMATLPDPVRRYFDFVFPAQTPVYGVVRMASFGEFRRPQTEDFNHTTAHQVIATGVPALMFSATTPVMPGIWARAYDFFANGEMEMKAKVLSAVTVVDEQHTPELNRISLRRWLLESALFPAALLPGGPVTWEAIDDNSARAIVSWGDLRASMVAHFDPGGQMTHMSAEADGDLSTPYHGSGEHVTRSNYQRVGIQMIPMNFTVSRRAGGQLFPFFKGTVDAIAYE